VFFPEGAFGPTNNCVGIGDVLRGRGHRVVFIVEESFAGTLEAQGFEERTMRLTPPPETEEAPGQFWKDFIRDTAPVFRKPTIEQLGEFIAPTFQALIDGARYVDARLTEILGELEPDLVVEDNVVTFPALFASGRPWARIDSCNPLEIKDPDLPPVFSGLPSEDRSGWAEFWDAYRVAHAEMHADFDEFCRERGAPPLPRDDFIHASPTLNLYLYPEEVDYPRREPLGPTWHNLGAGVRATDPDWQLPAQVAEGEEPLIYLSLGSLGSADVELMRTLVAELAEAPYRFIVSKGPQASEFELAPNMVGPSSSPRPRSSPRSTWSSPSTSASRWCCCRSSGTSTTTPDASTRPASASASTPTPTSRRSCAARSPACSTTVPRPTASPRPRAASRRREGRSSPRT
jgi:UDP:flavonoid glycosyltransferase YjiC (YdhE family)